MKRNSRSRRWFEATVGSHLLKKAMELGQKHGKLVGPKSVFLPKCGIRMRYYEREAQPIADDQHQPQHLPTLLFCHGISEEARGFGMLISAMKIPPHIRILCPEQIGHGEDLKAALDGNPSNQFYYKEAGRETANTMLESTSEFLDVVQAGPNCNAFGISLGGALVYSLRYKRPEIIKKTVLVCPAIGFCLDDAFVDSIVKGTNNFVDFQSRDDVKFLFRDLLSTGPYEDTDATNPAAPAPAATTATKQRRKKYPIPPFFMEAIYRQSQKTTPEGHYRKMMLALLETTGRVNNCNDEDFFGDGNECNKRDDDNARIFRATSDVDPKSPRLLLWPENDQISNCAKGMLYFEHSIVPSSSSGADTGTIFETIPDCGHCFTGDGRMIYDVIRPRVKEYLLDFHTH
ncbi:unnamed protein product [Pseudo-nitzschia multistriata]|uniref:AB hydrolase-1 domain-containing protein n=1 Tax=Pseudo-nitzschia multistriata TaxID=183589 RepID=A0A448Z126_9STRA|nr:unnamed protein product [Pseudo-nitzschia multistriata]